MLLLLKTYVRGYTKDDGTFVKPHFRNDGPSKASETVGFMGSKNADEKPLRKFNKEDATTVLYRAHGDREKKDRMHAMSSWSPQKWVAEAYTDNPGFGGPHIRAVRADTSNTLDLGDIHSIDGKEKLAEALGYEDPEEVAMDWHDSGYRYPWEEDSSVRKKLRASGYEFISYEDDYPDGAITYVPLHDFEAISADEDLEKSHRHGHGGDILAKTELTPAQKAAGNYKKRRVYWKGFEIAIEHEPGAIRSGVDPNGKRWSIKMKNPYGYLRRTLGVDRDQFDCYLGPDMDAENVYVITVMTPGEWDKPDEQKAMIGFPSREAAVETFLAHYDDKRFLGPVVTMTADEFAKKVRAMAKQAKPEMLKSMLIIRCATSPRRSGREG